MVESDYSEGENSVKKQLKDAEVTDEISKKRPRDDSSDAEKEISNKKSRVEEIMNETENEKTLNTPQTNGISTNIESINNDNKKDNIINNSEECTNTSENISMSDKIVETSAVDIKGVINNEIVTDKKDEGNKNNNDTNDQEKEISEVKDQSDVNKNEKNEENRINKDENQTIEKKTEIKDDSIIMEDINKSNENVKENEINMNENKKQDSEIINGVELTVECASDKEPSDDNVKEENSKPRSKTIIVREKPNDSEVDASSSKEEDSDSYQILEAKSTKKKISNVDSPKNQMKKKGRKKSFSKTKTFDSENSSESNSDDEDYSPIAKKKVKKSISPKKNLTKSTEVKRGRGRPRGRPPKNPKKLIISDENEEKEKIDSTNEKIIVEKSAQSENLDTKNEQKKINSNSAISDEEKNETGSSDDKDAKNGKSRKMSKRNIKKITDLKKYIRLAGINVKCYQTLLKDCKTDAAKAKRLHEFLEEHGLIGRPTIEKCKKLKIKNETLKEVQELDSTLILETNSGRGKNTRSRAKTNAPTSPVQKSRNTLKRIKSDLLSD